MFEMLDDDGGGKGDLIGKVETKVGVIMGAKNNEFIADLKVPGKNAKRGQIKVLAESVKDSNWEVTLRLKATDLAIPSGCLCGVAANTYLEMSRGSATDKGMWSIFHRSKHEPDSRTPTFGPMKFKGSVICNSNQKLPIMFRLVNQPDMQDANSATEVGTAYMSIDDMADKHTFELKGADGSVKGNL